MYYIVLILILLWIRVVNAATYYVDKDSIGGTCNDSNAGAITTPRCTISAGLSLLSGGGDTLYIRAGTYSSGISSATMSIPSGTSWSSYVTIAGYTGETVTLNGQIDINSYSSGSYSYIIFDNLIIDRQSSGANGAFFGGSNTSYIRFQNSEVKNTTQEGVQSYDTTGVMELINLSVHHNGSDRFQHGIYVCGNFIIRDSNVYSNAGYGIQIYYSGHSGCANGTQIYNNKVHDNLGDGGVTLNYGSNILFYNNLVYNNSGGGLYGISYGSPDNTQVYNNTIYGNGGYGIWTCAAVDCGGSGATNTKIKNNIVYGNGSAIVDEGSGSTVSNNLTTDPSFTGAGSADFSLQSGSSAIDGGTDLSSVFTVDIIGTTRPQGSAFDIGAYEYSSGVTPGICGATDNPSFWGASPIASGSWAQTSAEKSVTISPAVYARYICLRSITAFTDTAADDTFIGTAVAELNVVVGGSNISHAGWSVYYIDSEWTTANGCAENFTASLAFDNDTDTFWHTLACGVAGDMGQPHNIAIDLGAVYHIEALKYYPRQDGQTYGDIAQYEWYVAQTTQTIVPVVLRPRFAR